MAAAGGVPPGFRFHPTDEELLHFYLKKKIAFQKFDMDVIREVDLNKVEPWELQERCKIGSTPQNEWYFFSHKDRKYPTGSRTNRATNAGFWKATGRDKCIRNSFKKIGMRKTLVFYRGRAPHGQKTDWIMHEYRLEDADTDPQATHEDGWVVCRVFKKKNLFKIGGNAATSTSSDQLGGHQQNHHNALGIGAGISQYSRSPAAAYAYRDYPLQNQYWLHNNSHELHHSSNQLQQGYDISNHNIVGSIDNEAATHHQYQQQLEAQNLFSAAAVNSNHSLMIKPLMIGGTASSYHDQHHLSTQLDPTIRADHHDESYQQHESSPIITTSSMQVKQFMSSKTGSTSRDDNCDDQSAASPTGYQTGMENVVDQSSHDQNNNHLNEWDSHLAITTNSHHPINQPASSKGLVYHEVNPTTSSSNQISHLSLRSETDFWNYAK